MPLDTDKKDGTTKADGTGVKGGSGGRKKGPPSPADEIEAELVDLILGWGPDDQRTEAELEMQLAALRARLAQLKQTEAAKAQLAVAPPPRPAGTPPAPAPVVVLPKTKFEISVPTNAELAANLKGHLLLVHGEIDNNVHPANTMRLTDALIKANKRFDMLIIPGARHGFGVAQPYVTQRMWDFFAEHLRDDRQTGADINIKDVKRK